MAKIAKRRDRWIIDFYDTQGKRRWVTLPKGTRKKKAKDKLNEIENQLARGIYIPEKRIPAFKSISKDWLEYKKPNIRSSTWDMYAGHLRCHYSDINRMPIDRITTAQIEKFISKRRLEKMNITTLRKILVTLNQVLKYAVRHGYILQNPMLNAERPKRQEHDEKPEIRVLKPVEIPLFLDAEPEPEYKTLFMLAIMSGARQGELLGLKWSDVDWENNQIHVQRSYNHNEMRLPKTKKSNRRIDLGPSMMQALKSWRLQSFYSDNEDLIFPNQLGKPMCQSHMLSRHYHPALKAAGLPRINFHTLRHTWVSLKIEQGENLVYISGQAGHSNVVTTSSIYAHLIKKTNYESACGLEEMIFERNGSKPVAENEKGIAANSVTP